MPRASSSAKRQQGAAHQRDTRHENGLVGPGKRIPRQKSHNQLPDGGSRPAADDAGLSTNPSPAPDSSSSCAYGPLAAASAKDAHFLDAASAAAPRRTSSLGSLLDGSSTDSLACPHHAAAAAAALEENHRRIDVNAAKNVNVHRDPGPIDLVMTVLHSCPLYDTIAILIVLMQLSPIALSSVYMLFTLLTFVPPVTTSSGLSLTEIFEGTLGTPSLTTLVCMDIVVLLVWLFLWGPLQNLILDFAQVVIALTLGGGASSRQGSANNIFVCVGIVLFSHFGRYPSLPALLGADRLGSPDPDDPLEPAARALARRGAYSWVRNVFAVHILTQGIVRYIREWYLRREKRDMLSQSLSDPEAGKPPLSADSSSTDGSLGTPEVDSAAASQGNAAALSTKKKRKQSAQVRIRQPLWAALASTKIVMVKEYELSHAAQESAGSEATDVDNLGNAPFYSQPEQIWICYVGHDEVCFNTSTFPLPDEPQENGHAPEKPHVDSHKPFYVKVNDVVWDLTRILPIDEQDGDETRGPSDGVRWTGDIYGLRPLSNYECQFVCTRTGKVLFVTSVRTTQAPSREAEPAAKPANGTRRRHESPATTIKASIATQEAKLNDEKTKLKALRKENNRKVNALKKEIEKLSAAVQSAGGNDEKLRQKITQNTVQQKQAEQTAVELDEELKDVGTIPGDVIKHHRAKQNEWNAEKAQFDGARAAFKSFRHSIDKEIKALEEEQASLQAKRNKIATRIAKADNDHARITDANARGLDEAERRRQERAALESETSRVEQNYRDRITAMHAANEEKAHTVAAMTETMRAYLSSFEAEAPYDDRQYAGGPSYGPSGIPWSAPQPHYPHSSMSMWPTSTAAPAPIMLPTAAPVAANILPQRHYGHAHPVSKARGRSSSMLSDVSGFTQSSNAEDDAGAHANGPIGPPAPAAALRGPPGFAFTRTRGSSGSGSGSAFGSGSGSSDRSGSASGSAKDPMSPV